VQVYHETWGEPKPEPKTYEFTNYNEAEQAFKQHCDSAKEKFPVEERFGAAFLERE
jgi:hypothetical protein